MSVARVRPIALACLATCLPAQAQQGPALPGAVYENSRQDVTLPIATNELLETDDSQAVTIPLENLATPMRCMAAWSYIATSTIRTPEQALKKHEDFNEATASAHWQHWLKLDLDAHRGVLSTDFHQRRLAAEREFRATMSDEGDGYAYRTLGTCYVAPMDREVADPTILLRNFMIEFQGLPDEYSIPVLQRQLRAFPITEIIEASEETCDREGAAMQLDARIEVLQQCFDRGGILASKPKTEMERLEGACRASASVQCENIP